jgi:hypothetical protein
LIFGRLVEGVGRRVRAEKTLPHAAQLDR